MRKIRVILSGLLIGLIVVAWTTQINGTTQDKKEYSLLMSEADQLCSEKLYQQAIQTYESAAEIKDGEDVRAKWISAYELAYRDGVKTKAEYTRALNEMCSLQPKNAVFWEKQISLCIENGEYKSAYDYLNKADRSGVKSDRIKDLRDVVSFSYTEKGKIYTEYHRSPDGYYTVSDGQSWGVMSPDGEWLHERVYYYASPLGASQDAILMSSQDIRVIDKAGIVLSIFNLDFEQMRAPSGTVIPVCADGKWSYYDYAQAKTILSGYEDASSFANGIAAVKKNGKWQLINTEGATVSKASFEDVKLHGSGDYLYDDVMVAKQNGTYGLYDVKGNALCDFRCKDADAFYGDWIAYQDDAGKWGFVNRKGEVVISPAYEAAKSFSNGLAAVRIGEGWGFINASGKCVIESKFYDADYFTEAGAVMVADLEGQYHILKLRFPQ